MQDEKHAVAADGDSDLSFESLTFGGDSDNHANGQQGPKKNKDKIRKKPSTNNKKEAPPTPEGERGASVYITTTDDKLDVQALLRRLEIFGSVRGYYFKEKANFGIVQFVDPSVADAVIESFGSGDATFKVSVERTPRAKDHAASPHSFGSMPPPSLGSTPSAPAAGSLSNMLTSPAQTTLPPPEKPDTILVLKNLPFTLKQDQLHEILLSLSTTIPQSISLHFDNGVFRGMAFIKYRQLDDAIQVYELLNGMDVGGRKVRVEYKRKPAAKAVDIPIEWQEDEELRRLWEQLKEFKEDAAQSEWYYPPTLTNNQRRNIYNMTERLKLVQGNTADGESRVLFLRKTAQPSSSSNTSSSYSSHSHSHSHDRHSHVTSPTPMDAHHHPHSHGGNNGHTTHTHSGSVDNKSRGMDIKGRRTRHDSDANSRSGSAVGSPNDRGMVRNSSVGRDGGIGKHNTSSSAPSDMNLDWRGAGAGGGGGGGGSGGVGGGGSSTNNSYNNHAQFAHNMQIHHQQQQMQQQQGGVVAPSPTPSTPTSTTSTPLLAPLRQPRGPDGSKGFDAPRKSAALAFQVPS